MGGQNAVKNFTYFYSMLGMMTDVNIWNYSMAIEQMKSWTRCISDEGGNVINWETAEWTLDGLKEEILTTKEEFCEPDWKLVMFNSPLTTFKESTKFCKILGGNIAVADNNANVEIMTKLMKKNKNTCHDYETTWAGYTDTVSYTHLTLPTKA